MPDLTCIHAQHGLCPACQAEYDADKEAWLEYGNHPAGLARWRAELEAIAADQAAAAREAVPQTADDETPF